MGRMVVESRLVNILRNQNSEPTHFCLSHLFFFNCVFNNTISSFPFAVVSVYPESLNFYANAIKTLVCKKKLIFLMIYCDYKKIILLALLSI